LGAFSQKGGTSSIFLFLFLNIYLYTYFFFIMNSMCHNLIGANMKMNDFCKKKLGEI
jgi:fatty-acid desaturase